MPISHPPNLTSFQTNILFASRTCCHFTESIFPSTLSLLLASHFLKDCFGVITTVNKLSRYLQKRRKKNSTAKAGVANPGARETHSCRFSIHSFGGVEGAELKSLVFGLFLLIRAAAVNVLLWKWKACKANRTSHYAAAIPNAPLSRVCMKEIKNQLKPFIKFPKTCSLYFILTAKLMLALLLSHGHVAVVP